MIVAGTEDPLIKWAGGPVAFGRGQTRAMVATAAWWIAANRADKAAARAERLPDLDRADGCTLERQDVPARPGGAPVAFVTMRGGGHAMPSVRYKIPDGFLVRRFIGTVCRDVEGAELAWAFLSAHRSR
jgi:poly(3-hydroxybutyrate) depolymerase